MGHLREAKQEAVQARKDFVKCEEAYIQSVRALSNQALLAPEVAEAKVALDLGLLLEGGDVELGDRGLFGLAEEGVDL